MTSDDDLSRRATRSIGWLAAERWASRLTSLLVLGLLARLLTPADFGVIALATSVIALVQVFVDSGFSKALVQRSTLGDQDASTVFWTSLGVSILLAGGLIASSPLIAGVMGNDQLAPVLCVLSLTLPISALSQTPAALLERDLDFRALSIRQFAGTLVGAAVAIPMALVGLGIWALIAQTLASSIVAVIVLWSSTTWRPRREFSVSALRDIWLVGGTVLGIDLLDAIQANIDKVVIGLFFPPDVLGAYFLAQKLGTILIELVTSVISRVSLTTFSRVQDDSARLNRIFQKLTFAAASVSVFVFAMVAALAPQIVHVTFGDGWEAAVPILWILAPGWALSAVMFFDRNVLIATSHARSALVLAIVQNAVSIALVFAFVPFGVLGIAFSRLARFVVWPLRLYVLHKKANVKVWRYLSQILRCIGAVAVPVGLIALVQSSGWFADESWSLIFVLTGGTLAGLIYSATLWRIAGEENRVALRKVIGDMRRRGDEGTTQSPPR